MKAKKLFHAFSTRISRATGSPWAFLITFLVIMISGIITGFSEQWKSVIGTWTAIIGILLMIILQHTQNTDSMASHLKMDELIKKSDARNEIAEIEVYSEDELTELKSKISSDE